MVSGDWDQHKKTDQNGYCRTTTSKLISLRLMRIEKKLLANAGIATLIDAAGTDSPNGYDLVWSM